MPKDDKQLDDQKGPSVEVVHLNTNAEAKFHTLWTTTVQAVWDQAYVKFGESRREGDSFEAQDGTDLTPYLTLTLEQLRDRHIAASRKFQIKGPVGGAWRG